MEDYLSLLMGNTLRPLESASKRKIDAKVFVRPVTTIRSMAKTNQPSAEDRYSFSVCSSSFSP